MWPFARKRIAQFPPVLEQYLGFDFSIPKDLLIGKASFVVLDCETTGFARSDEIITIGAVNYANQSIDLKSVLDLSRGLSQSGEESTIHGELSHEIKVTEEDLIEQTLSFLSDHIVVGHHISFDIQMLQCWIADKYPGFKIRNRVVDTLQLIKRLDPQRIDRRVAGHDVLQLDALCREYGIEVENRHTALGDAYMTAQLFHHLTPQLEKRGIVKLRDLIR